MTGTGTQADPFIIESWDEFKAGIHHTASVDAYYSVPEGTVWDMNELEPNGVPSINFFANNTKLYIHCNGLKIKNARVKSDITFINLQPNNSIHLYGINIINVLNEGTVIRNFYDNAYTNIHDSIITGISSGNVFVGKHYMKKMGDIYRCGLDIELNKGYLSKTGSMCCHDSHIRLTTKNTQDQLPKPWYEKYHEDSSYGFNWLFNNCLIELDIEGNGVDNTFFQYGCYSYYTNNVIKARGKDYTIITCIDNNNKIQIINTENNIKTLYTNSIYASEDSGVFDEPINSKEVTTEQLKDADYLRSLGFPIGV